MERKNRAKSIWENDLRVYLVSLNNNARINLYYRQQNWEDLISSLRKIITTKSKNTFLSQENNKLLLQQRIEWLLWYSLSSQFILEYVLNSLVFFFPPLLLKLIYVTNMIQLISSPCTLVYSVLLNELYV